MPIGGLKWQSELEEELEPKEFKKIKSEIQVLGIDDAPFDKKDKDVKIVAVLTRGAKAIDGVFSSSITRDGIDATERIVHLVTNIKRENARAIILDGVTFGGFNTVDINRVYRETGIPVIASMDKRPDHEAIHKALKNLSDSEIRKKMIASAGEVHTVRLDDNQVSYMQIAGIKKKDAEEIIKLTTVNGLVPEPVRAAHLVGKGAYNEVPPPVEVKDDDWIHVKAYNYIKDTHKQVHRWKHKTFPGIAGEIVSFLFAVLVAWCIIQFLGFVLGTPNPLVVIESQSMEHYTGWEQWYQKQNMSTNGFNAMNIGDIVLVKGDNPKDIQVGDVIVYTKYNMNSVGGEPIIHRVIGIADISGSTVHVQGELDASANSIRTPCGSTYSIDELKGIYSTDLVKKMYPDLDLNNFRVFITKGDNNNGEDQCKSARMVSFPVHEKLVQGRAKFDLPYVGYIKLGLVCVVRYASGNVCSSRCWWAANHPNCNSNGIVA